MHGTVMYKVPILRRLNGFDESLRRCEKMYDLLLRLSENYLEDLSCQAGAGRQADGATETCDFHEIRPETSRSPQAAAPGHCQFRPKAA